MVFSLITEQFLKSLVSFLTQAGLLNISSMEWANFVCCWDSLAATMLDSSSGFLLLHISSGVFQSSFIFLYTPLKLKNKLLPTWCICSLNAARARKVRLSFLPLHLCLKCITWSLLRRSVSLCACKPLRNFNLWHSLQIYILVVNMSICCKDIIRLD